MKNLLLALLMAAGFGSANAQYMGTLPPNVDGRMYFSTDSDDFNVMHSWVGAAHESGFGARIGYSKYDSPYISANSQIFQLTYVNVGENHDFHGAIGVRNVSHSTDLSATGSLLADQILDRTGLTGSDAMDIKRDAPKWSKEIIESEGGKVNGNNSYFVADANLRLTMTDRFTMGFAFASDLVESTRSIQTGTRYYYTAVDGDYLLSDNININVILGNVNFTDDNNRPFIRTKTTWTFLPEYGVSTYLRTRNQSDTNPGSTNYFSPDTLAQQAIGLAIRKPYSGHVYTASVDYGSEQVKNVDGSSTSNPIYSWMLGVQTNPGRKTGITYGASLMGSNSNVFKSGGDSYDWYGITLWLKVPL